MDVIATPHTWPPSLMHSCTHTAVATWAHALLLQLLLARSGGRQTQFMTTAFTYSTVMLFRADDLH